jgi:hypothetical protein
VKFQRFFRLKGWDVGFEVRRGVVGREDESGGEEGDEGGKWSQRLEKMMLEKKDENWKLLRDGQVDGEVGRVDVDNWLKMSGWKDVLTGVRSENVKVWLRGVDVDGGVGGEEEVLKVCESFVGRLVRNMMMVVRSKEMDCQCLKLLNRREVGGEGDGKKMYVGHLVSTLNWYMKVWKVLLRFVWRMWKCEVRSETEGKLFDGGLGFVLSCGERDVLVLMEEKGRELIGVWREKKVVYRGDVKRVWKDEEVVRVGGQLEECVLGVLMEMMGLGLMGNGGKSVFLCGSACLGLNLKDGGWKEVDGCTQVCAAVLTIGKLFVLYNW